MDQIVPHTEPVAEPAPDAKRILIVEDDAALAEVYQTRLLVEGFAVKHAANGEEALMMVSDFHPDLVMLDIILPKLSGFEVLSNLREHAETAGTKVIVLSAFGDDNDRRRASELGADDYLVKSQVVVADVISKVNHYLGLS